MNKHITILLSLLLLSTALLSSCEKFLSEPPSKSSGVVPETVTELDGLLNAYTVFAPESMGGYLSSDDYAISPELWTKTQLVGSLFYNINFLAISTFDRTSVLTQRDYGWANEWKKIFTANLVLTNLDKVSGSDTQKAALKAEAHFIRAYSYFALANVFCLPYTAANLNEPGLPIKESTSFDESTTRATLADTYKFIESDLAAAMSISQSPLQNGKLRNWRVNAAAVHTFAARYYLALNNYQKALDEANASLAVYSTLNNYNNSAVFNFVGSGSVVINRNSTDPGYPQQTFNYQIPSTLYAVAPGYAEITYYRYESLLTTAWAPPSQELMDSYDKTNDLRWTYHYMPGFTIWYIGLSSYPAQQWPSYNGVGSLQFQSGPSVPEAILIKAECQARLGDATSAMTTVNALRATRFKSAAGAGVVDLAASNPAEAVTKVLQERRRELALGWRFYDMRRLNNNADPTDDIVVNRTFYNYSSAGVVTTGPTKTYTLPVKSRAYAYPIPLNDIVAGNGSIQQNTY